MNIAGLALCARYAFPPNSLSLCGPNRPMDLSYYSVTGNVDNGTIENLTKFHTLYPYLCLIAGANHKQDAFDPDVVNAYWIGNKLLNNVPKKQFNYFLDESLEVHKKIDKQERTLLNQKIIYGGLPHHAFHVLNIYRRTGHVPDIHTLQTMDACIINWGEILAISDTSIDISTSPLRYKNESLIFSSPIRRSIEHEGKNSALVTSLHVGDVVTYHWGKLCTKLSKIEHRQLQYHTNLAISFANKGKRKGVIS